MVLANVLHVLDRFPAARVAEFGVLVPLLARQQRQVLLDVDPAVGIAAARGLGLAAGLPIVGVTTLEAIAANVPPAELDLCDGRIAAVLDARRNELYFEIFGSGIASLGGPRLVTVEDAMALVPASGAVAVGSGVRATGSLRNRFARAITSGEGAASRSSRIRAVCNSACSSAPPSTWAPSTS